MGLNRRAGLPVLVFTLGLAAIGWLAAHCLAYALTAPTHAGGNHHAAHALGGSAHEAHDYLARLPLPAAIAMIAGLALVLRFVARGGRFGPRERLLYGRVALFVAMLVPAAAFVAVELLERALTGYAPVPPGRLLVVGVVTELAVGALVLGLARLTLVAAERALLVASHVTAVLSTPVPPRLIAAASSVRPGSPLALRLAGRAPPTPPAV